MAQTEPNEYLDWKMKTEANKSNIQELKGPGNAEVLFKLH